MTPRLPALPAAKLLKIQRTHGFRIVRQSGSHRVVFPLRAPPLRDRMHAVSTSQPRATARGGHADERPTTGGLRVMHGNRRVNSLASGWWHFAVGVAELWSAARSGVLVPARAGVAVLIAAVIAFSLAACSAAGPGTGSTGTWVGTISTEGDVTTVVNESGSVWGGTGRLVEEASIGVEVGPPEYMLGSPGGLFATDDEVYVTDGQVPIVRVYDWQGTHLRDIGAEGQGPGEYMRPGGVLVADDRVYISEAGSGGRINVYSRAGEAVGTWTWPIGGSSNISGSQPILRNDGAIMLRATWYPPGQEMDRDARRSGWQQIGPEGLIDEPVEDPDLGVQRPGLTAGRGTVIVPFTPSQVTAYSPTGAYIVGDSSSYAFEVRYPDERVVRVERFWTPVPISQEERDYAKRSITASARRSSAGPSWTYDGPDPPDHHPAYYVFTPTRDSRVMATRYGPSRFVPGCDLTFDLDERPTEACFEVNRIWDMFDLEGKYLGEVDRPSAPRTYAPFWHGNALWIFVEDEAGLIMVKRYRLLLPHR